LRCSISNATDIITFWREAGPERWFAADPAFDRAIAERFGRAHLLAAQGALAGWEEDAQGALALLLLTDQFPRNIYRGNAHAFATDEMARAVADRAIVRQFDQGFESLMRNFFYLPFMHHEDMASQARAIGLYERLAEDGGDLENLRYAHLHADLIARFGRFPHRNVMMGRLPSAEEAAYLAGGGFAG
jgi:uncharacterized protein (DUF924 family)